MWTAISTAWAFQIPPTVLAGSCETFADALPYARAWFEAQAGGLPPGADAIGLEESMWGPDFVLLDADRRPLSGSVSLNPDCTLGWISPEPGPQPQVTAKIEGPPGPLTAGARAVNAARSVLADRAKEDGDVLVAVPAGAGWDVWLVRSWPYDLLTVARATVAADGTVGRVVDDVHEWVPPTGAVARMLRSSHGPVFTR